jgi:hypothetical protein
MGGVGRMVPPTSLTPLGTADAAHHGGLFSFLRQHVRITRGQVKYVIVGTYYKLNNI